MTKDLNEYYAVTISQQQAGAPVVAVGEIYSRKTMQNVGIRVRGEGRTWVVAHAHWPVPIVGAAVRHLLKRPGRAPPRRPASLRGADAVLALRLRIDVDGLSRIGASLSAPHQFSASMLYALARICAPDRTGFSRACPRTT